MKEIKIGEVYRIDMYGHYYDTYTIHGHRQKNENGWNYGIDQESIVLLEKSGFYKVNGILNSREDEFENVERMDLELEKIAPLDWIDKQNPEEFFIRLMKMGFTVVSREISCPRYDDGFKPVKKQEWARLAVSPERGCVIHAVEYDGTLNGCEFSFVYPTNETWDKILPISCLSSSSQFEFTVKDVAPNFLDVLDGIRMMKKEDIPSHRRSDRLLFILPFVNDFFKKIVNGRWDDVSMQHTDEVDHLWGRYYGLNRKYIRSLPESTRSFLMDYTDIGRYFSKKCEMNRLY